jgi:hypothetical protein
VEWVTSAQKVLPIYPTSQTIARFSEPFGANRITSACGTMIHRDELLGAEFSGNAFICEPVHNLVHRDLLQPSGVTFTCCGDPPKSGPLVMLVCGRSSP